MITEQMRYQAKQIVYVRADIFDAEDQLTATGQGTFKAIKAPLYVEEKK